MTSSPSVQVIRMPRVVTVDDLESSIPLEHTLVSVHITGPLANVAVNQRFGNPLTDPAELDYLFPLPDNAAVTGFEIQVGSRKILGDLQERETAQAAYDAARDQGKRAGLFEQRRPNLFAVRLANIQAGEVIQARVQYQQRLRFDDGTYEFVFPMGLTPKYDRPQNPQEGQGTHAPIARAGEKIGPVEFQISVDAGLGVHDPTSPSHPIETIRADERRFQVSLVGEHIPDHDFVMRYPLTSETIAAAGWVSGKAGKEFFLASLTPPRMEGDPQVLPREFIFVLDRSGSMTGEPIAQARNALRACLRSLNPIDTFRILLFDNELEWFQSEALPVEQSNIERADAYLARVQGRGGTEILQAVEVVLGLKPDAERTRYVIFLTDGAVSAEAQALDKVRSQIGSARLFTFGIGPSVNRALLSRMARLGRGKAEFLQLNEDIEGAIIRFQDSVSFPLLTNITLVWENGKTWDVYPNRIPDLYYGESFEICGRLARTGNNTTRLKIQGQRADQMLEIPLLLPSSTNREKALERVWAQARVEDLLERQALEPGRAHELRTDILGLALEYNLVTLYTSFVAVDQETASSGGQKPRIIHVAQPLPQGLSMEGFRGGMPMQALGMMMPASAMPPSPASFLGRSLRSVVSKIASRPAPEASGHMLHEDAAPVTPSGTGGSESAIRWLARTQKMDGSWNGDIEMTSAAVLAFIRAGYTTRTGTFRQAVRRAVAWLIDHPASGFAGFARMLALEELAKTTGDENDKATAQAARLVLKPASNPQERAAAGEAELPPTVIQSLDDLRLAGILKHTIEIPERLIRDDQTGLSAVWAAALGVKAASGSSGSHRAV